jgi:hypothetical protein
MTALGGGQHSHGTARFPPDRTTRWPWCTRAPRLLNPSSRNWTATLPTALCVGHPINEAMDHKCRHQYRADDRSGRPLPSRLTAFAKRRNTSGYAVIITRLEAAKGSASQQTFCDIMGATLRPATSGSRSPSAQSARSAATRVAKSIHWCAFRRYDSAPCAGEC